MGKFGNYILTMSGLLLVFYFLGLLDRGFTSSFLDLLLDPQNLQTSGLVISFGSILSGLAAIVALRKAGFEAETSLLVGLIPILLGFGWDFLIIFQTLSTVSNVLAVLIFGPFMILYVITIIEWWRGVTT